MVSSCIPPPPCGISMPALICLNWLSQITVICSCLSPLAQGFYPTGECDSDQVRLREGERGGGGGLKRVWWEGSAKGKWRVGERYENGMKRVWEGWDFVWKNEMRMVWEGWDYAWKDEIWIWEGCERLREGCDWDTRRKMRKVWKGGVRWVGKGCNRDMRRVRKVWEGCE
jgi:hypothetical protein